MVKNEEIKNTNEDVNVDFLTVQYQVLSNQKVSYISLLWSIPSLLLVAQTLFWSIELNQEIHIIIRCMIAFVSLITGVASYLVFERIRLLELADSKQLYSIEKIMRDKKKYMTVTVHRKIEFRDWYDNDKIKPLEELLDRENLRNRLNKRGAVAIWNFLFKIFIVVSLIILLYDVYQLLEFLRRYILILGQT